MNKLYLVATPIGNLGDITLRAVEILSLVKVIACEDTRVTARLVEHFQLSAKLVSYHQHSSEGKVKWLLEYLKNEGDIALVTDAGTPGISDPGNLLVAEVVKAKVAEIVAVPGSSALTAALSISGLPTDRFTFFGFLPHKKGKETMMRQIAASEITSVFYESTHRIIKTLEKLADFVDNNRQLVVCRELTKKFETVYRGSPAQILQQLDESSSKGEFVVMVAGLKQTK